MRIFLDRHGRPESVYVAAGEPLPALCGCGAIYVVPRGSSESKCPQCGARVDHKIDPGFELREPN
jgi:hypothetical protein